MTLKVKVNDPRIQYQSRESRRCIFGANLVILGQIHYKLLRGQSKFPRILSRNGQNDHEGESHWLRFSIPDKSIPWCMFEAKLVIPAQICDELLRGHSKFCRILSQNRQNDLEGQGKWSLFFKTSQEYPKMHVCCKFGVSSSNLWRVSVQTCRIS